MDQPLVIALAVLGAGLAGAVVVALAMQQFAVRPLQSAADRSARRETELELTLLRERAAADFRDRLDAALRAADSEAAALRTGLRAIAELVPDADVSLLIGRPDGPDIGWRVRLRNGSLEDASPVTTAAGCGALANGRTTVTTSALTLDACDHLADPPVDVSAVCLPLRTTDRLIAAICVQGAPGAPPPPATVQRLEGVTARIGDRVAELREISRASTTGRRDPLTGLPGRAALRTRLREMVRSLTPFCAVIVDIDDHRELPTDELADEAVRAMADVLCSTLRPDDLICRLDGPRFAAVLPQCSGAQAGSAMERAREALALWSTEDEPVVRFTFSAGIVESHRANSLNQIVELADAACGAASIAGGNRATIAD